MRLAKIFLIICLAAVSLTGCAVPYAYGVSQPYYGGYLDYFPGYGYPYRQPYGPYGYPRTVAPPMPYIPRAPMGNYGFAPGYRQVPSPGYRMPSFGRMPYGGFRGGRR